MADFSELFTVKLHWHRGYDRLVIREMFQMHIEHLSPQILPAWLHPVPTKMDAV